MLTSHLHTCACVHTYTHIHTCTHTHNIRNRKESTANKQATAVVFTPEWRLRVRVEPCEVALTVYFYHQSKEQDPFLRQSGAFTT